MTTTTPTFGHSTLSKADQATLNKIIAAETKQQDAQRAGTAKALEAWRTRHSAERARVIGPGLLTKLADYAAQHQAPSLKAGEDNPIRLQEARQRREQSFRFAHDLGLNWAGLAELSATATRELHQIVAPPRRVPTLGDVQITDPRPGDPQPLPRPGGAPAALATPTLAGTAAYGPPYPGWWERQVFNYASGSGHIASNDSYLWQGDVSQMGAIVGARNYSASDFDLLSAYRENGYLVPYTPDRTGYLEVQFDLQCGVCQHSIWLHNEWGWSDCTSWTNEAAVMSVFWNWEDVTPASETYDIGFVYGLDASGNGNHYPGGAVPALPGQRRTVTLYSTTAFPAGVPLWLYVGSQQRLYARLNDVSADLWVNSAWNLTGLRVRMV